ncbi:TIGR04283 family arsenosugar biosynthesis glycosyltransferase [Desulfuribacillus stibiiarsenatis]|uniref:TIGR04283 family arsenosugar biosynthesis glycosyltransferase n=1 Tax=Desulfuribacillus stibiiarsenatis TaxID=1390249 RepID=UPI0015B6B9BA|nr:TIGR04283 family arsenosugar biosynthesis glycosyltransferase [Desulfuribacillus stibiiarsenatis]
MANNKQLSVIIPTLNEQKSLPALLSFLTSDPSIEVIVADGGSSDKTVDIAIEMGCIVTISEPGRALQMNQGASKATSEVLLFLHADSQLPSNFKQSIITVIQSGFIGGAHKITFFPESIGLKMIAWGSNIRGTYLQSYYGDQGIFVRNDVFHQLGKFPLLVLMEDVAFSKILRRHGKTVLLDKPIVSSSRRFLKYGVMRTILTMQWIKFLYFLGVSPTTLKKLYS